ncbi:MAG TPA: alpha/beta fold hydrolase [Bryobacteraceae bacterium]|nr:alpha/beta fold hydrolase [Bryobacteraceae bacterium]
MASQPCAWVQAARADSNAHIRLFCFPYAGGGASLFRHWQQDLSPDIEVRPIQLPGRENRLREAPFSQLTTLVDTLFPIMARYFDRSVALFGHSMGAYIAYELACRMEEKGVQPVRLLVSGRHAPHLLDSKSSIHALPDSDLLRAVQQRYGGIPAAVWQEPELLRLMMPALRADLILTETYRPSSRPKLTCPISVFGGNQDQNTNSSSLNAWQTLTRAKLRIHTLEGGHFFLHQERRKLLELIAGDLNRNE